MAIYQDILKIVEKEVGVTEYPAGSNNVKYNTWYYGKEVSGDKYPWCCALCAWVMYQANASTLFYGGKKTASCGALKNYAVNNRQWVTSGYKPGDLVMMNFNGKSDPQHVGIVVSIEGNTMTTIEGNTSFDEKGSQSNGGAVAKKKREFDIIVGAYRPQYDNNVKEDKKVMIEARQIKKGSTGDAVKVLQAALNALQHARLTVDGDFGTLTEKALKEYQTAHKLACGAADGICGKKTWESLLS